MNQKGPASILSPSCIVTILVPKLRSATRHNGYPSGTQESTFHVTGATETGREEVVGVAARPGGEPRTFVAERAGPAGDVERLCPHHSAARFLVAPQDRRNHRPARSAASDGRVFFHGRWDTVAAPSLVGPGDLLLDIPSRRAGAAGDVQHSLAAGGTVAGFRLVPGDGRQARAAGSVGG